MWIAAQIVSALVALLHLYFLVLEMVLWDKPTGRRVRGGVSGNAGSRRSK